MPASGPSRSDPTPVICSGYGVGIREGAPERANGTPRSRSCLSCGRWISIRPRRAFPSLLPPRGSRSPSGPSTVGGSSSAACVATRRSGWRSFGRRSALTQPRSGTVQSNSPSWPSRYRATRTETGWARVCGYRPQPARIGRSGVPFRHPSPLSALGPRDDVGTTDQRCALRVPVDTPLWGIHLSGPNYSRVVDGPRAGVHDPRSVGELRVWFARDAACLDYLESLRWPVGFVCPVCNAAGGWRMTDGSLRCRDCRVLFSSSRRRPTCRKFVPHTLSTTFEAFMFQALMNDLGYAATWP